MITIEIDEHGYATVYSRVDGKLVKDGGYPYKYWYMMVNDLKTMVKKER